MTHITLTAMVHLYELYKRGTSTKVLPAS